MMRILLVGAEPDRMPRLKLIKRCLDDLGYETEIFNAAKRNRRTIIRYMINMVKLLFKRADVYHFFSIPDVIGLPLLFKRGVFVYDIRSPWKEVMYDTTKNKYASWFAEKVERLLCKRANVVIAVNPLLQQRALEFGAKECSVVPNYPYENMVVEDYGPLCEDIAEAIVLYFGKISKVEGSEILVDVIIDALTREKGKFKSRVRFLIAGDGPELETIKKGFKEADVETNVHYLGWVPHEELGAYIKRADICIMPRKETGTSHWIHPDSVWKVNEAINLGTPIVATKIGGFQEDCMNLGLYCFSNDEFATAMLNMAIITRMGGKETFRKDTSLRDWTICRGLLSEIYEVL